MLKSLRYRLIALCVAITVLSMLALSVATVLVARNDTLDQVDAHIAQLTQDRSAALAGWVAEKQRVTGSMKLAVDQSEAEALRMAASAKNAGGFDDAYIAYADKRTLFNHATRELHGLPEEALPAEDWASHYDLFHPDGVTPMEVINQAERRALASVGEQHPMSEHDIATTPAALE